MTVFRQTYVGFPEAARMTKLAEKTLRKNVKRGRLREVAAAYSNYSTFLLYRRNVETWSAKKTLTRSQLIEEY